MPGYSNEAKNSMLAHMTQQASPDYQVGYLSLHTDDPGSTGDSEVTGGDPAYSRISVDGSDFTTPSGGETELNNDKTFNGPDNGDATYFGVWAVDGTTFLGGGAITGDNQFNSDGEFILQQGTKLDLNA